MELYSKAIVGRRCNQQVYMVCQSSHVSRAGTAEVEPVGRSPIAETTTAELATWLGEAINHTLDGRLPHAPRPEGDIQHAGRFFQKGRSVCSWDIANQRPGFEVALADTEQAAIDLTDRLNALLDADLASEHQAGRRLAPAAGGQVEHAGHRREGHGASASLN